MKKLLMMIVITNMIFGIFNFFSIGYLTLKIKPVKLVDYF